MATNYFFLLPRVIAHWLS